MSKRPTFIDLRSQSHGPLGTGLPSPRGLLSPRLHVAGEIPPELSPLDAFAAQSRLLAKQLNDSTNDGKRMSRLPPLAIEKSLSQTRPGYLRSMSTETAPGLPTSPTDGHWGGGTKTEVEAPGFRPVSVYPIVDRAAPAPSPRFDIIDEEEFRGRRPPSQAEGHGFFGARREQSPPPLERDQRSPRSGRSSSNVSSRPSMESMRQRGQISRRPPDNSLAIGGYDSRALAPPRSPFAQRTPSPRSVSMDSSDEDFSVSGAPQRKLSSGSTFSASPTGISPSMYSMPRSPSISSEISIGGTRLPRPAFNFSRPLSRASEAPPEIPSRQASSDSQPSFVLADDTVHTPISIHSEGFPENSNEISQAAAAPSYVYSKFSLPRGKMLQRNSLIFQEGQPQVQYIYEPPASQNNAHTTQDGAPPSPPSRPSTSSVGADSSQYRPSMDPGRPSLDPGRSSLEAENSPPSVASSSTIKARSQHSLASSAEWSAEEHVSKAIEYHEAGSLTKSTYHLRLAARQNHPTGMLLYALACRHGWGMRPNQKEGVAWLRRAADSAGLEVADDENLTKDGKAVDVLERKARKAQFALSIYELGVSHMNGWGIDQDKVLALRCFEIAGCMLCCSALYLAIY